jgi:D-hydroxyproline dehydrogenase subunit beta
VSPAPRGTTDAIVIGAGLVGAAIADALTRDGARVTILDAGSAAGGATAAGMGHLVAMDDSPAQLALTAYSLTLWRALQPTLPPSCEYDACGTLWVAEDEGQVPELTQKMAAYSGLGIQSTRLNAGELSKLEPQLRPGLAGGLLVSGDGVVYPPAVARVLLDRAVKRGAMLREHTPVEAVGPRAVILRGETLRADIVVNAAGTGAAGLTPRLPIVPRKGHLVITDRAPGFCRHQIVEVGYLASAHVMTTESTAFNVQPRATGQVLIGSSRELVGWDGSVNRGLLGRMLARAVYFMPGVAALPAIRVWTGFRPATPDQLPLIGKWEETEGLWIAAGHEGLGITTSLGTAGLLADLIAGRAPVIDAAPYAPSRSVAH